ncbi:MAG: TetR/AcrR family transcriptional regulator [Myxococcota bacterium]
MTMPTPSLSSPALRRSARGERTRERILSVAEKLFAERGFAGASLRDVAGRVGIRTPSLYNHFSSKEALYEAVLSRAIRPLVELLSDVAARDAPRQSSRVIVERVMEHLRQHPLLPRLVQQEVVCGGERLSPALREWLGPIFAHAHHLTRERSRRWSPDEIPHVVLAIYNAVLGYFTMAPLCAEIGGLDLLSSAALERQTRILGELAESLLSKTEA